MEKEIECPHCGKTFEGLFEFEFNFEINNENKEVSEEFKKKL